MIDPTQTFFTPVQTFLGGYLLHLSTSALLEDTGTVLGVSGIIDGLIWGTGNPRAPKSQEHESTREKQDAQWVERYWRMAVVGGMIAAPITASMLGVGGQGAIDAVRSWDILSGQLGWDRLALAGVLVGLGSRLGSGCTSGHFLCGASRLSPRSIVATAVFFPIAMVTSQLFPMTSSPALGNTAASYVPTYPALSDVPLFVLPIIIHQVLRLTLRRILALSPVVFLRLAPYILSGWTFGMGLVMSGMADPLKVVSFLRISPLRQWDPSLAMVFLGGVIPNAISYRRLISRRTTASSEPKPAYSWANWRVPSRRDIDWKLVSGAAVFGAGWGLGGVCPGPALVGVGSVVWDQLTGHGKSAAGMALGAFAVSVAAGMRIGRVI